MKQFSRRSFLKLSALTAAAAAVAGTATGCSVPVMKPGYTVKGTLDQRVGDVNVHLYPLCSTGENAFVSFVITNMTDKPVDIPLSAFNAECKGKTIAPKAFLYEDETTKKITIPANGENVDVPVTFENIDSYPYTAKIHLGTTSIEYKIIDSSDLMATTPYTEYIF